MPTRLCAAAGFWIEPPVSSATPHVAKPAATAVAVPALLAPDASVGLTALSVTPSQDVKVRHESSENAGMLVLPRMMAPASMRRCTAGALASGKRSTPPVTEEV